MDFKQQFEVRQRDIKMRKMYMVVKRAMAIQTRNKIKPSSMNPVLLNSPMSGGTKIIDADLDLYWPGK